MEIGSKKICVGKSKLHGEGLFAIKNIKKGEEVFTIKGKKINFLIHSEKKAKIAEVDWIGIGKNKWYDPKNYYGSYFNHSCNPNTVIKEKITVVAIRNIKKGEEITFDYSTTEADIFWDLPCYCGEKKCRKTIRSVQFIPKEVFNKYEIYIPKYYKMVYNRYRHTNFKNDEEFKKAWINFLKGGKYDRIKKN